MIISPSCTTIMFSLKLMFALFMVCLLHFYGFVTNSTQTLWQLSGVLLEIVQCFSYFFFDFILLQKALPEPLACSGLGALCLVHGGCPGILLYHPMSDSLCCILLSWAPFLLIYWFVLEEHFLLQLPKECIQEINMQRPSIVSPYTKLVIWL